MIGKNSCFSPNAMSITTGFLLFLFTFLAYSHASAQTEPAGQLIAKSNNTILNDPLRNAILTFSDGTSILDLDGISDLPPDTTVITTSTSGTTDSSDQSTATTSGTTDSSDQSTATTSDSNLSRTTSADSDNRATSGEVGSTSGEVGSTSGEVGTSTGELQSPTGEVGS